MQDCLAETLSKAMRAQSTSLKKVETPEAFKISPQVCRRVESCWNPGGKTYTADVKRRIFINVCRNFRNVACLRHWCLCPVR